MVQEQLVDYISSQLKLGVTREAIRSALVTAGWVAGDVDDTLKKVTGGTTATPVATVNPLSTAMPMGQPVGGAKPNPTAPQTIRVSDLISGSPAVSSPGMVSSKTSPKVADVSFGGKISGNTFQSSAATTATVKTPAMGSSAGGSKKGLILGIVAVILILASAGAAAYFYSGNAALASKVATLTTQSASVTAQLSSLQAQIASSSNGASAQVTALEAANADLSLDLSFYVVPIGTSSSTAGTAVPITVSGSLSGGGKAPYSLTTPLGAKIFISNPSASGISTQLAALVGQTISLTGTHIPGSDAMTVSSVTSSTTP